MPSSLPFCLLLVVLPQPQLLTFINIPKIFLYRDFIWVIPITYNRFLFLSFKIDCILFLDLSLNITIFENPSFIIQTKVSLTLVSVFNIACFLLQFFIICNCFIFVQWLAYLFLPLPVSILLPYMRKSKISFHVTAQDNVRHKVNAQ